MSPARNANNIMVLKLDKLPTDIQSIKNAGLNKIVEAVQESRTNHNVLVDALLNLSKQIDDIASKLDEKAPSTVVETLNQIKETTIPALKDTVKKNHDLSEAKLFDARGEIDIQHEQLEAHGRRLNIIWHGRAEQKQTIILHNGNTRVYEDTEKLFRDFCVQSLLLPREYVDSFMIRDCHRLNAAKNSKGPAPVICGLVCQRNRNDIMAAAKNLKGTPFSIKSDLPKRLNKLRGSMLQVRSDLKKEGKVVRLIEQNYLPCLQVQNPLNKKKWNVIYDINGPKNVPTGIPRPAAEAGQRPAEAPVGTVDNAPVTGEDAT